MYKKMSIKMSCLAASAFSDHTWHWTSRLAVVREGVTFHVVFWSSADIAASDGRAPGRAQPRAHEERKCHTHRADAHARPAVFLARCHGSTWSRRGNGAPVLSVSAPTPICNLDIRQSQIQSINLELLIHSEFTV